MHRDISAVRSLIQKKADANAPQANGATALHWAVQLDARSATEHKSAVLLTGIAPPATVEQ